MNGAAFVTGASGFIGGQLVTRLLAAGRPVRALSRRPLPELAARGAEVIVGDLDNLAALVRGCTGATTVFHVAGRVGVWGPAREFFHVNVEGTSNVIVACRAARVPRLVYTSSPSVVYQGRDLAGVDESAPLCTEAPCAYPTSKAAAERLVQAAHGEDLATVSLRPHLVWGPGDKNVVPRVLALARQGRLKIIGHGRNRVDVTHIANVVDAHLLAEQALARGGGVPSPRGAADEGVRPPGPAGGRTYFITNGEPVVLWDWINRLLRGVGLPEITAHVSLGAAYAAGGILEALWRVLPLAGEPPMTRFVAKEMATDHWFDISAACRDLGYSPRVTMAAGTEELIAQLKQER
ncbi:MAG TPA: NAD-dependent epimerase/dehydratase family protein [Lacunisphaera sp.]|nr:NAD-dependent epimerase/dehydratase family protein [Lacunisphaera sp.]